MYKIFIVSFAFLLFGCAIGPDYVRKDIYSDKQIADELNLKNISNVNISSDWFHIFGDENLNNLIEITLKNSPNIKIAKEKLLQARYNLYNSAVDLLPVADISGEYTKSSQPHTIDLLSKQEYFRLGFDASWELDIWGGKRRLIESSNAMLKYASANFDNIKSVLISEVVSSYINWRLNQKLVEETNLNITNQTTIFENIKSKHSAGLVDDLTLNQAESLLKSTMQKLPQLVINEKKNLNSLAILTGILPSKINNNKSEIMQKKPEFNLSSIYDIPTYVIRNRPDVHASEQNLIAQNALIGNKISNLFPSLSLQSFLGFQNKKISHIFGKNNNMYSNDLTALMPFLHWGSIINEVKTQTSVTNEALINYQSALLQAIIDVSNALKSVDEGHKNYMLADDNLLLYQNISNLSQKKYEIGLIAFSDFLQAKQDEISAQTQKYQALADMLTAVVSFYKSIGGGFSLNYSKTDDRKVLTKTDCEPCKD